LANGTLDALISARTPPCYFEGNTHIGRLFEDFETAEKDYYRRTRLFPIMHAVGIRRDIHERYPWLAASVYKAFNQAMLLSRKDLFDTTALSTGLPWLVSEAQRTSELMGEDFWSYGVKANLRTLETMLRYSEEQYLTTRRLRIEEMFAPSTLDEPKT
ncbi:MAG: ABC transporter substrate-binding protein, partial [Candidatus Binataceae bacterium]